MAEKRRNKNEEKIIHGKSSSARAGRAAAEQQLATSGRQESALAFMSTRFPLCCTAQTSIRPTIEVQRMFSKKGAHFENVCSKLHSQRYSQLESKLHNQKSEHK